MPSRPCSTRQQDGQDRLQCLQVVVDRFEKDAGNLLRNLTSDLVQDEPHTLTLASVEITSVNLQMPNQ